MPRDLVQTDPMNVRHRSLSVRRRQGSNTEIVDKNGSTHKSA
jgi:hypothetical protein